MKSLAQKTFKGLSWTTFEQLFSHLTQLFVFLLLARLVSKNAFGLVAIANILVAFLNIFAKQGFSDAIVQRKSLSTVDLDSAFWASAGFGVLLTSIGVFLSPLVGWFFDEPQVVLVIKVLSMSFLISSLAAVPESVFRKKMDFKPLALRNLFGGLVGGTAAIIVAWQGGGVWSLVVMNLLGNATAAMLLWHLTDYRPHLRFSSKAFKEMVTFGGNLIGYHVINFVNRRIDFFLIGKFYATEVLGLYSIAYKIIEISRSFIIGTIAPVAYPLFCKLNQNSLKFRSVSIQTIHLLCILLVPLVLTLVFYTRPVIHLLYGSKWIDAVPLVVLLSPLILASSINWILELGITSMGRADLRFKLGVLFALISIASMSSAVTFGIYYLSTAASARFFLHMVPVLLAFSSVSGTPSIKLLQQLVMPLTIGSATFGICYFLWTHSALSGDLWQIGFATLSTIVYMGIIGLLKKNEISQFVLALKNNTFT